MDNKSVKRDWKIAFLPGDGTGPEIMKVTLPVIRKAAAGTELIATGLCTVVAGEYFGARGKGSCTGEELA